MFDSTETTATIQNMQIFDSAQANPASGGLVVIARPISRR